jgi:hypothetical protein
MLHIFFRSYPLFFLQDAFETLLSVNGLGVFSIIILPFAIALSSSSSITLVVTIIDLVTRFGTHPLSLNQS